MLDFETVEQALIDTIRTQIGGKLSTLPNTTFPSVVRQREGGSVPQTPYVTFEEMTHTDFGGWLRYRKIDDSGSSPVVSWVTEKQLVYRIYCYGDLSLRILEELVGRLVIKSSRNALSEAGASIVRWNAPTLTPRIFADQYDDNAFFDIFLNAKSVSVESDNGYIETVEVDNELIKC